MSGWTPVKPVNPKVKKYCLQLKAQIESMAGVDFKTFEPEEFISQDEDGMNTLYVVKVDLGSDKAIHVKISETGDGTVILEKINYPKLLSDPLVPI